MDYSKFIPRFSFATLFWVLTTVLFLIFNWEILILLAFKSNKGFDNPSDVLNYFLYIMTDKYALPVYVQIILKFIFAGLSSAGILKLYSMLYEYLIINLEQRYSSHKNKIKRFSYVLDELFLRKITSSDFFIFSVSNLNSGGFLDKKYTETSLTQLILEATLGLASLYNYNRKSYYLLRNLLIQYSNTLNLKAENTYLNSNLYNKNKIQSLEEYLIFNIENQTFRLTDLGKVAYQFFNTLR